MTEESRVSRTPRTWTEGSEEPPADVTLLYREDGGGYVKRVPSGGWWYVEFPSSSVVGAKGWAWSWAQGWPLVEVLPDAPEPQPANGRDAGSGDGWDKAIDWLLNSRFLDSDVLEHFCHMCDGFTDCRWCYEELKGTNHAIPMPKGYDL